MFRFAVVRVQKSEYCILQQESLRVLHGVKRQLYARLSAVDAELMELLQFGRSQGLPVSRSILKERGRIAENRLDLYEFKASNGYIDRFIRRNAIQKSICLLAKGIFFRYHGLYDKYGREKVDRWQLSNEDGVQHGRNWIIVLHGTELDLLASEDRSNTRDTELQKHKLRNCCVVYKCRWFSCTTPMLHR